MSQFPVSYLLLLIGQRHFEGLFHLWILWILKIYTTSGFKPIIKYNLLNTRTTHQLLVPRCAILIYIQLNPCNLATITFTYNSNLLFLILIQIQSVYVSDPLEERFFLPEHHLFTHSMAYYKSTYQDKLTIKF